VKLYLLNINLKIQKYNIEYMLIPNKLDKIMLSYNKKSSNHVRIESNRTIAIQKGAARFKLLNNMCNILFQGYRRLNTYEVYTIDQNSKQILVADSKEISLARIIAETVF
jgi:hypothetical protein